VETSVISWTAARKARFIWLWRVFWNPLIFSYELKGSRSHLFGRYGRIEIKENPDIPAHANWSPSGVLF